MVPTGIGSEANANEEIQIAQHLERSLGTYWPGGDGWRIRLRSAQRRAGARLYWYDVLGAEPPRAVVVKLPQPPSDDAPPSGRTLRPRLVTPMDPARKYEREYAALQALETHFERIGDPRFQAIRPLDRIDGLGGFVTEVVPGSSLKRHFAAASRATVRPPPPSLWRAMEGAGAWLRAYHRMPMPHATVRQGERADYIANVWQFAEHLSSVVGRAEFFRSLARAAESSAPALPDPLPLGLTHGDYAMRNILITPAGRVAALDTLAQWRSPIYEDVAKFGLSLRSTRPQILSHRLAFGASRLERALESFYAGFFSDGEIPRPQIRMYELLLLLDKWSFERAVLPRGRSPAARYARHATDSWFITEARTLLTRVP